MAPEALQERRATGSRGRFEFAACALVAFALVFALVGLPLRARADDADPWPPEEQPDVTRLDVERLPPEAIEVTRDLYAHGFYAEAWLGARGYVGGLGDMSNVGPMAAVGVGYELFPWLWAGAIFECSFHGTDAPAPPSPTIFEQLGLLGTLRFQLDLSARAALWLGGEVGAHLLLNDVLETYGYKDATSLGLMFGGSLGGDWHFVNQHTSIGLLGGARMLPSVKGIDDVATIAIHGALYLRYVF
ncbi:MAG: hypothetical protein R3A78_02745 [Polyangiales bacterium]|nr:hypothetical protein [Myxococcales bacterium]